MEIKLSRALATNLLQNLSNPLDGFVSYIFLFKHISYEQQQLVYMIFVAKLWI